MDLGQWVCAMSTPSAGNRQATFNDRSTGWIKIHPLPVRLWHWVNAAAVIIMIMSGWRIYNASPLFQFRFPDTLTLGGWLAGALQWHFAAMWILLINFLFYLLFGIVSGHFKRSMFPLSPASVVGDLMRAARGRLPHKIGVYNAVQRLAYVSVLAAIGITILSGISIWKPVQYQELATLFGGYEGARVVHFLGMTFIVAFIVIHLVLVLIVPSTFLPMINGGVRMKRNPAKSSEQRL
jgi:thiosulfate reductase cytochrome b subunit